MSSRTLFRAALVATALSGSVSMAQDLRDIGPPAEFPPDDYTANQYVDSRGCVYVRAGIGGNTTWVPRVNRAREALCGFAPSLRAEAAPEPQAPTPAPAPAPRTPVAAAEPPAPVAEPEPQTAIAARPAPAPAPTVRTNVATPRPVATPPSPRIITVPMPAPQPAATAPEPRRITLAEACAGRTGVQPNMISSRTGEPIDCGSGAIQTAANAAPAADAPRRVSRGEICAEIAATGRQYIDVATGAPVACPSGTPVAQQPRTAPRGTLFAGLRADLTAPRTPYSNPLDYAPGTLMPPRTAVNARSVLTPRPRYTNVLDGAPGAVGFARPAPYSNPTMSTREVQPRVPDGYEQVWEDGRLNPQRGLQAQAQVQAPTATVSTRTAAPQAAPQPRAEAISGQRYVQVATFASRADAQSVAQSLRARGLPMRVGVYQQGGREMRIVLAGPFGSNADLQRALAIVQGAGYGGAFTRR